MRRRTGAALPTPGVQHRRLCTDKSQWVGRSNLPPPPPPHDEVVSLIDWVTMCSWMFFVLDVSAASSWPAYFQTYSRRPLQWTQLYLGDVFLWCCAFGHQRAAPRLCLFTLPGEWRIPLSPDVPVLFVNVPPSAQPNSKFGSPPYSGWDVSVDDAVPSAPASSSPRRAFLLWWVAVSSVFFVNVQGQRASRLSLVPQLSWVDVHHPVD